MQQKMDFQSDWNSTYYCPDNESITSATILLQRVVRGYLTRKKLGEAKEIFESLFSEVENDDRDCQIVWEHNDAVCWPVPMLTFKPKPPPLIHTGHESRKLVPNSSFIPQDISKSIDCIDSLLDEIASLNCSAQSTQSFEPKTCSSQPSFGTTKPNPTEGSRSTPSLIKQEYTNSMLLDHNYQQLHGQCKLCRKLQTEAYKQDDPRMCNQSLRSKCTRSDIWRPAGVPAKKVDGTMFRKTGCYKGQQDDLDDLRERIWSYSSMVRQKMKLKAAKQARSPPPKHMPTKSLKHWPKSGIRPSSPTHRMSSAPQDDVRLPPESPQSFSVSPSQSSPRTPHDVRECAVQIGEGLRYPTSVDAIVQTLSEKGVQTDMLPCKEDGLTSLSPTNRLESTSVTDAGVHLEASPASQDETLAPVSLSSSPTPVVSNTDVDVDITSVTPLNPNSLLDATQSFTPSHKDSSTPVAAAKDLTTVEGRMPTANPSADETSVWVNSPSHATDMKKDLTQKELETMKENMSMELVWIEQAIASRKQYLSLMKDMKKDQVVS